MLEGMDLIGEEIQTGLMQGFFIEIRHVGIFIAKDSGG
jgi:hypothetical protein